MKSTRSKNSLWAVVAFLLTINALFQSCRFEEDVTIRTELEKQIPTRSSDATLSSWETKLNEGIKLCMPRLQQEGLSLLSYKLQGVMIPTADIETNIESLSKVPVYDNVNDWNIFSLLPFGELNK